MISFILIWVAWKWWHCTAIGPRSFWEDSIFNTEMLSIHLLRLYFRCWIKMWMQRQWRTPRCLACGQPRSKKSPNQIVSFCCRNAPETQLFSRSVLSVADWKSLLSKDQLSLVGECLMSNLATGLKPISEIRELCDSTMTCKYLVSIIHAGKFNPN